MSNKLITLAIFACLLSIAMADNWAVVVAGSNGFWNYRHQADVCHAYHTLIAKGLKAENIIVLSYDDAANSASNPFPGTLYNKPSGKTAGQDVYAGCKIDYKGKDVTPETFLAVIQGDVAGVAGKGNGRVLGSTAADKVFLNFADHGGAGLIAFPSTYLYADTLLKAFENMHAKNMYSQLVFYLEACESGSMFLNLPKDINLYAISASSPDESSWGTYCSPDDVVNGKVIGSCLGDLFSVNWMEDTDISDSKVETLQSQFVQVAKLTDKSQVMQWGETDWLNEPIGEFVGEVDTKPTLTYWQRIKNLFNNPGAVSPSSSFQVDSRLIKLFYLENLYKREPTVENQLAVAQEKSDMNRVDIHFEKISLRFNVSNDFKLKEITNFDCLRQSIAAYEKSCGKLMEYGLKHVKTFAQICQTTTHNLQEVTLNLELVCDQN